MHPRVDYGTVSTFLVLVQGHLRNAGNHQRQLRLAMESRRAWSIGYHAGAVFRHLDYLYDPFAVAAAYATEERRIGGCIDYVPPSPDD